MSACTDVLSSWCREILTSSWTYSLVRRRKCYLAMVSYDTVTLHSMGIVTQRHRLHLLNNIFSLHILHYRLPNLGGRDSVVIIVTRVRAGRSGVRIPAGTRDFSLLRNVQTGFGAHSPFYSMGTGPGFFPGRKAHEVDNSTSIQCQV
jgi:hypothetical protein